MRKRTACLLLLAAPAWAVVDIAPEEVGETPGVSGNIAATYSSKDGNTDSDEADVSGKLKYDNNRRSLAFVQGAYERSYASDVKTEDDMLTHARYLHKLYGDPLYGEAFVQFHENTFKGIDDRWLVGGNLRWRFLNNRVAGKLYAGGGAFQEELNYTDDFPEEDETMTRMNGYLAYTVPLTEKTKFSMIAYYQPAFEAFRDRYASVNAEFTVHVVSGIHLSLIYELDHDSMPPEGIMKDDREFKTSLLWKF